LESQGKISRNSTGAIIQGWGSTAKLLLLPHLRLDRVD
jgi:hypothetical protein